MIGWEEQLAECGYRLTASRRAVIEVLRTTRMPLSPQHILDQGKVLHPPLGLVTVYRMLNLLVDMNLVRRVHFESGCHGYLPASPGHHHAVICQVCGQASEFPGDGDLEPLLARVESWTGYRVEEHLLQLYGLCPTCQKSTSSPEG